MEKQEKEGHSQFEEFETGEETQNSYEKYIRIKDGVRIYKISRPTFTNLAKKIGALHKVGGIVLVNARLIDEYLNQCRIPGEDEQNP